MLAVGAADAALAAPGMKALHRLEVLAVDVGLAEAQPVGRLHRRVQVLCEHRGGEAEVGVVGQGQRLVQAVDHADRQHRAEDLLGHDVHRVGAVDQHRGLVVEAGAVGDAAAGTHLRALLFGALHQRGHLVQAGLVHQRAHAQVGVGERVAELGLGHQARHAVSQLVGNTALHVDALGGVADLPGVEHARVEERVGGEFEIGVVEHDRRRLAPEFEVHAGQVARGGSHDVHAGAHAAGEGDQAHVLVLGQAGAGVAAAGDQVEHPLGQAAFGQQLGEVEGVERRGLARLDDDGVAGDEGRSHLAGDQEEREVPGQDAGDHADRATVQVDLLARAVAVEDFALDAARPLGHVVHVVGGEVDLDFGQRQDLALLQRDAPCQARLVLAQFGRHGAQVCGALDRRQALPGRLRGARGGHRAVDVCGVGVGYRGNQRLRRGVVYLQGQR